MPCTSRLRNGREDHRVAEADIQRLFRTDFNSHPVLLCSLVASFPNADDVECESRKDGEE